MDTFVRNFKPEIYSTKLVQNVKELNENITNSSFKILHLNICSISKNFDGLVCFLKQVSYEIDIIVLTETHKIYDLQIFHLPQYQIIYNEGNYNKCDGVVVLIKESIIFKHSFKNMGVVKCVELVIGEQSNTFLLTCLYKSPSIDDKVFVEEISDYLFLNENVNKHIITGDINLDILREDKQHIEEYKTIMATFGYTSYINKYTRPSSKSCLDHFFVKGDQRLARVDSLVINYKITDHCPILLSINNDDCYHLDKNKFFPEFCKKYICYDQLRKDIRGDPWIEVYQVPDINLATTNFIRKLQAYIEKNTQTVRQTRKRYARKTWVTNGILKSITIKNNLYKEYLRDTQNIELKNSYIKYKNNLDKLIKTAKKSFAQNLIKNNQNRASSLWDCVNKLSNKAQPKTNIEKIMINNNVHQDITDPFEISNYFNRFFCEVGEKLSKDIADPVGYQENIKWNPNSKNFFQRVSIFDVEKVINELKCKKSPGHDGIRSETLKEIVKEVSPLLVYLMNFTFSIGSFPNILKLGQIRPLFKQGSKTDVNNYRPISLLSNISKIFEKIIKKQMIKFLDKHNIISDKQFGFRTGKSTEDALLNLCSNLCNAIDNKKATLSIFVDLTKAFDTVSHKRLIGKLQMIGFRGSALNLFKSYLNDRKQFVKINNVVSDLRTVTCGVPQGTVLGPLLFIIYVNDLLEIDSESKMASFADDGVMFYSADSWEGLKTKTENDFGEIGKWFQLNKLTLNVQKTKFLTFASCANVLPDYSTLNINENIKIAKVNKIKYLGVIIDQHMRWDEHAKHLLKKLRYIISRFKYLENYLKLDQLKIIYYSLFQSQLTYGLAGWGGIRDCYLAQIEVLQKWALKIIFGKNRRYPTNLLYKDANVLDIRQLYFFKIIVLIHKKKIKLDDIAHAHNTRHKSGHVNIPKTRKEIAHRNFEYLAPKFFNFLPNNLKVLMHEKVFQKRFKQWMYTIERAEISNLFRK